MPDLDDPGLDTDTSLALLASLLEPTNYPLEVLIGALADAQGDISIAAERLLLSKVQTTSASRVAGKRKAGPAGLDSWLKPKAGSSANVSEGVEERAGESGSGSSNASPSTLDAKHGKSPTDARPSPAKRKPPVDLLTILKQPETTKAKSMPQPAVLLSTQAAIDKHGLPLSLLTSPLSPSFASALYLAMMAESEKWERHRWYLAGKWVESPHTMTSYARVGGGHGDEDGLSRYYYSGSELSRPDDYPALLKMAADMIEPVVNASLGKRKRYPLEHAGPWRANVCGANRYDGASSGVGWHADQLTYLGPYTTIASLSLGTPRAFRLRETDTVDGAFRSGKPIRTYEVNLGHNSLVLMNAGCQERYKHTVPPQKAIDLFRPGWDVDEVSIPLGEQKTYTSRINITFRFFRDDFHPLPREGPKPREGTPLCRCGMPALLRADQKAKVRTRIPPSPAKKRKVGEGSLGEESGTPDPERDDMAFFWQCQSPGQTGDMKGCGFFRVLDMAAEGRGPCFGDAKDVKDVKDVRTEVA